MYGQLKKKTIPIEQVIQKKQPRKKSLACPLITNTDTMSIPLMDPMIDFVQMKDCESASLPPLIFSIMGMIVAMTATNVYNFWSIPSLPYSS